MKKFAVLMLLALVGVVASAQTSGLANKLMGKWQTSKISALVDEDLKNARLTFHFKANNQCSTIITAEMEAEEEGMEIAMKMTVTMPGTWKATGTSATVKPNASASTIKINSMTVNGVDFSSMASEYGELFKEAFRESLGNDLGTLELESIKFNGTTGFSCTAEGERLSFVRKP